MNLIKQTNMKRNLLIGIIGGAAVGAAAAYLLDGENRRNLTSGLSNRFNSLLGKEEEEDEASLNVTNNTNASASRGASSGRAGGNLGGAARKRGTGRRG